MSDVIKFPQDKTPELLQKYVDRGFHLIFYPHKSKIPPEGWNSRIWDISEYREGQNVGIVLGNEITPGRFLADIDLDWAAGIKLSAILPFTKFGFGHPPTKPASHLFYTTSEQPVYRKYTNILYDKNDKTNHLAESGQCFVELRGGLTKEGLPGQQTMVPPSIWVPKVPDGKPNAGQPDVTHKGERLEFYTKSSVDSEIAHDNDLPRRTTLYAIACLLHANIPAGAFKHEMRLACAGFFLTNGLTREETTSVMKNVVEANGPHDKGDELTAIETTLANINRKQHVTGRATFIELIDKYGNPDFRYGNRIISEIIRLLGGSEFLENKGKIVSNQENIRRAMEISGVRFSYNEFSGKSIVHYPGDNNGNFYSGEVEDNVRRRIWLEIERKFNFLPRKDLCYDVMDDLSWENKFHPVLQYLKSLTWDKTPRIDAWVIDSAGAEDTPYVRAVSAIMLKAAVRRITQPGCKFDEMVIFESGTQGLMKSTALRTLCPNEEWFSDHLPLNLKPQELIEITAGKWIVEVAELNKIKSTQMEQVKSLLSRQDDTARLAYRHDAQRQKRQSIFIGTTNSYNYLTDQTGNRRFWPIRIKKFDVEWIRENRDQLWAEAYARSEDGESIRLSEELYSAAEEQQSHRLVDDDWRNALDLYFEDQYQRVAYDEIWEQLAIPLERRNPQTTSRVAEVMQSLGFTKATSVKNRQGKTAKGWMRNKKYSDKEWNEIRGHDIDILDNDQKPGGM